MDSSANLDSATNNVFAQAESNQSGSESSISSLSISSDEISRAPQRTTHSILYSPSCTELWTVPLDAEYLIQPCTVQQFAYFLRPSDHRYELEDGILIPLPITMTTNESAPSPLVGLIDRKCPNCIGVSQPQMEVRSVEGCFKNFDERNVRYATCGVEIRQEDLRSRPVRRTAVIASKKISQTFGFPNRPKGSLSSEPRRRRADVGVEKEPRSPISSATVSRSEGGKEKAARSVQYPLEKPLSTVIEYASPGRHRARDVWAKWQEMALTKVNMYVIIDTAEASLDNVSRVIVGLRKITRGMQGWKRATNGDPLCGEEVCKCGDSYKKCRQSSVCLMNDQIFQKMYYRKVFEPDDKVDVSFLANLALNSRQLASAEHLKKYYAAVCAEEREEKRKLVAENSTLTATNSTLTAKVDTLTAEKKELEARLSALTSAGTAMQSNVHPKQRNLRSKTTHQRSLNAISETRSPSSDQSNGSTSKRSKQGH